MNPFHRNFRIPFLAWLFIIVFAFPVVVHAGDDNGTERVFGVMQGVPASVSLGGANILPKGHAVTAFNFSYRDKSESVTGTDLDSNQNADYTMLQAMLKLRYALTDRLELQAVIPYVVYNPDSGRDLDSWADTPVALTYGVLQEKFGDPFSLAVTGRIGFPTGSRGQGALPGSGAWSAQGAVTAVKTLGFHQVTAQVWDTLPMQEGNKHLRKGNSYGFNYKWAYALTSHFDAGIEGTIDHSEEGKLSGIEVQNDYTEWYTGPAINYNIPDTNIDLAFGAYLPVYREYGQNTSSESARFDFKVFLVW